MSTELRRRSSSKDYSHYTTTVTPRHNTGVRRLSSSASPTSIVSEHHSPLADTTNGSRTSASSAVERGHLSQRSGSTGSTRSSDGGSTEIDIDGVDSFMMGSRRRSPSLNYSQLPNGGNTTSSGGSGPFGISKWQRNAVIAAAVLIGGLLFVHSTRRAEQTSSQQLVEDVANWRGDTRLLNEGAPKKTIDVQTPETNLPAAAVPNYSDSKKAGEKGCLLAPGKQATQYALMIDAGSTGSRMHVYTFSNCLPAGMEPESKAALDALPTLKDELFFPITPGLSSYKGNPKAAAESLRKLMDEAVRAVPKSEQKCTPVAVKATAGLRLLGHKESQAILNEIEQWLQQEWPFHVVDNGVTIMDGSDEGVYAWITINYLLGTVGPGKSLGASAAVMDLGGASTQIVFEPTFQSDAKLSPGDHVYDLNFAATKHVLYQHSHLGYGLMQARRSLHNLVAFTHVWQSVPKGKAIEWEDLSADEIIHNPCLVKGGKKVVLLDPPGRKAVNVTFLGTGAGFDACRRLIDVVMAKDALCDVEPCAFGGVYQPKLMDTFGSGPIYALSYFYDRIVPLGLGRDAKAFTIADLRQLSEDVCAGPTSGNQMAASKSSITGWTRFKGNFEAMAELADRPEYCLDLSFMYSLLSLGYELAADRELVTGKKINDIELGWALGAGIALLEHTSLKCRAP